MTQTLNHARLWRLSKVFAVSCVLILGVTANSRADEDGINIRSASWNNSSQQLNVSGSNARRNSTVTMTYYGDDAPIGATRANRRGRWSASFSDLNPVPCRIRVTDGSSTNSRSVSNAPNNCSDDGGSSGQLPGLSIANVSQSEGDAGTSIMTFMVILSSPAPAGGVTFDFVTADGSATVGNADYIATSDSLSIAAGDTTATIAVTIQGDTTVEQNETFTLNISSATNTTNATASAIGTIVNDDDPQQQVCNISVTPTALAFGDIAVNTTANRSATVSNAGTAACSVTLALTGINDFAITPPTGFSVAPGASSTISVSYTPGQAGADSGNVAVNSNDPDSPTINVDLSGNGVQQQTCPGVEPIPNTSINSTSVNSDCQNTTVVNPVSQVANNSYSVLAINDLGMHCGDLDTRISSILPPFQVLLGQVIQKGSTPVLNPAGISLYYSSASNPNDPILGNDLSGVMSDGSSYKTNFWDTVINRKVYNAFYPFDIDGIMDEDVGLPVPNLADLYINSNGNVVPAGTGIINAVQHAMPGISNPYSNNVRQLVQEHYIDKPFFVGFPFGYVAADVNWYEGAGIPFAAFDDFGRENAYPLVRVEARNGNTTVSTVDTVLPISGEASCTNCHADNADYTSVHGVANRTDVPTAALSTAGLPVAISMDDPDINMPPKVSLEYAADINILRLHDLTHGGKYVTPTGDGVAAASPCHMPDTDPDNPRPENGSASCLTNKALEQGQPVVCQVCHYTPALDLAHVGPKTGPAGTEANGRNQLAHKSNSNVMHNHHGSITALDRNNMEMFPDILAPLQDGNGNIVNQATRVTALENSCYQCHPGKSTKCLRGAMFNGDMLCSDCHGSMLQVGADFSDNVSPSTPGAFVLNDGNFYDPASSQPRVPWANEPGCGSCHTGDSGSNLARTPGTLVNTVDTSGNPDGIRLRQAFRTGDAKATPIVPTNKRFAEPAVPASFNGFANPGAGNPQLYRVSTGHGGVMCEGCHGATHAEWPNANPNANDNVTANQLQGHTGTIVECSTCHGTAMNNQNTLGGPHGMHPVGDNTSFARGGHENLARGSSCTVCHGPGSRSSNQGTVLSLAKADRNLRGTLVRKGEPVGCSVCHGSDGGD
jgi:hypothetical protein